MSRSGEKHAQDYNLILCILMALRATYFLSVIYGDPVLLDYLINIKIWHLSVTKFYLLSIHGFLCDIFRQY